jgi:hypothetical protein
VIVWHYTVGDLLPAILIDSEIVPAIGLRLDLRRGIEQGELRLDMTWEQIRRIVATRWRERAGRGVPDYVMASEQRPVVWFSSRDTWEPTAASNGTFGPDGSPRIMSIEEMVGSRDGLVRIGVDRSNVALHAWDEYRKVGRVNARVARALVHTAVRVGSNPGDWFVHYGPVPRAAWLRIERSKDGRSWSEATP